MDITEFKEKYITCSKTMYWAAYRLTGNNDEAEDIVQETFLRLWSHREFLDNVGNAEAYSVRMVRNVYIDKRRGQHIDTVLSGTENLQIASADDIVRRTEHRDLADKARDIIDRLPEQQRRIVFMKDIEDMTYDEMAGLTGLTVQNLRTLLSRGRKTLRQLITGLDRGQ